MNACLLEKKLQRYRNIWSKNEISSKIPPSISLFSEITMVSNIVCILLGLSYEFLCPYICYHIILDPDNTWCMYDALMQKIWFKTMVQTNENKKASSPLIRFIFFPLVSIILVAIFQYFDDFQMFQVKASVPWRLFCFITSHWSVMHVRDVGDQCISNKANVNKLGFTCKCNLSSLNYRASLSVKYFF